MQKARSHITNDAPTACRRTVSGTISLPCHGCFSPFPHGTGTLSVSGECLALADGPAGFTQGSTCPALLGIPLGFGCLRIRDCHPLWSVFPGGSPRQLSCHIAVPQPLTCRNTTGLGSSPFARHYWGNHILFSLPLGTKMFQFPRFASMTSMDDGPPGRRVAPFGHPRIAGRLHLPAAFRSLPRPSSPSGA